ncbi:MAG TPA: FAD-dependent oxidoreductase [Bryobacteraceae bacterium]|jgi:2-polyprenyl-6-methoxyphenol hydroxylase-like FAD-dependent oxidoreductase|nr:FAD-dependent oxidoreductase [Bryobacteraceae bacterium]
MNALSGSSGTCCIAGGGPAGMMLGYLLARAGVEVLVLEKHADFLRDFRGDTIHPSTLEVMHELGVLKQLLMRPHQKTRQARARIAGREILLGDMESLRMECRYVALMPQWDFLDFLAQQASRYPTFHLRMQTEITGLIEENGRIAGIRGKTPAGAVEVRADLVVGADGRNSVVRDCAGLIVDEVGAPMDVLWMRLPKRAGDPELLAYSDRGRALVLLDRGSYWQCGFSVPKGMAEEMQAKGIEAFRTGIVEMAPFLHDRVSELRDWNDVKLLTVRVDRLRRWYRPGVVCIGDAAHAMSPVAGVGINLAIQDAVAAANILAEPLRAGMVRTADLAKIQRRREFATRITQRVQAVIRQQVGGSLDVSGPGRMSWPMRILERTTILRRLRTRFIGIGIRPEHVKTPDIRASEESVHGN